MKIVILDGYTENPGDLSWEGFEKLGELCVYDRTGCEEEVIRRIAEILNKFREYRITVEGHANPVLGTAREENETLKPLSLARAQFVIEHLVGYGVSRGRLSPIGRGGTRTVARAQDQDNSWKNRRVEFLLIK